jgi:biofilm PGA synthesis N-glycosyltransferase PgaC
MVIILYTFIGYGMLLFFIIKFKRLLYGKPEPLNPNDIILPTCTLIVAAYNEQDMIPEKIINTLSLAYPAGSIKYIFVTDGSTDQTPAIIAQHPQITLLHQPERSGKIAAVHRAINQVETEIIVFTDANTLLNKNALIEICKHYADPLIGAVAGEKRVHIDEAADATAGEGFYWKYESKLKQWDSELYSVVGAAGELFSIRKNLYEPVPRDSVLDDFMISMRILEKGHRIVYEPLAYAMETASSNITEELKRKIRISAGGIQSILYLRSLFNIFKFPIVSFEYISHRVLRWTITPFLLILAFILNGVIALQDKTFFYLALFLLQVFFYTLALIGFIMERRQIRIKALFIPYYFCIMNYAVIAGIFRFFNKGQNVVWDKAERKQPKISVN